VDPTREARLSRTRRHFFGDCALGLGSMALALLGERAEAVGPFSPRPTHHTPRAKRVIYLHMAGGPSQLELFDPKPKLRELNGQVTPRSLVEGKRFAFLKPDAKLLGSNRTFARHGRCGAEISELLPHIAGIADEICIMRGMVTDVFNHGPAKMFMQSGSPQPGRPAMGAWLTYGIGSESSDLPGFVVLQSGPRGPRGGSALWTSGFLPSAYQGVPFLPGAEPILNVANPPGFDRERQADVFGAVRELNRKRLDLTRDPEIAARIAAYETAFRMQVSAPELMDLSGESPAVLAEYGVEPGKPSFAANCLLARRLAERGVRFVQLYHTDWDHHGGPGFDLGKPLDDVCREVDRPCATLVRDLKRRGLLEDTIVLWGGEFGRTPMGEPRESLGRDHHIEAFTMWGAGGGLKAGVTVGRTDDIGYQVAEGRVHVHDLHATLLHLLGLDHRRLVYRFQGRDYRLTDVYGEVVPSLIA
jgi:hypothetical protein